jgi:Radical SAM superfamily/4Fe-4S single cluster domain
MKLFDALPQHRTLSILPTFRCTAECEHCGSLSNRREKTFLPLEHMIKAIDEAAQSDYKVVVFTGGEPTLAGVNLIRAIKHAASCGLVVRMVTNAYWAIDEIKAEERLRIWLEAGLCEINYSTGDQHARFVPIERVIWALRAAVKAEIPVAIMVETLAERKITKEFLLSQPEFERLRRDYPGVYIRIDESPWMPLSPTSVARYPEGVAVNRHNLSRIDGCDSVLTTTTIEADGRMNACCGLAARLIPELQTGTIATSTVSEADATASRDFLKRWIRVEGPERILAWAASYNSAIKWEDMYAHRCQACLRLYKDPQVREVILRHHREKIPDVIFREWLLFHYRGPEAVVKEGTDPALATRLTQRA